MFETGSGGFRFEKRVGQKYCATAPQVEFFFHMVPVCTRPKKLFFKKGVGHVQYPATLGSFQFGPATEHSLSLGMLTIFGTVLTLGFDAQILPNRMYPRLCENLESWLQ